MQWKPYVSVARRRANAMREMSKLRKNGKDVQPVQIEARTIARTFWGKGWCDHLESFSDYENRLPRGRTYVRNGSVCHLAIRPRCIEAIVSGSELYNVRIEIQKLKPNVWNTVKQQCAGRIGSMLELLQGRLSDQVMTVVTDRSQGLFPQPKEIKFACDCPDWAVMCKHVAAVLYGVGSRLDERPELLFLLRDVEAQELIATQVALPAAAAESGNVLADDQLGDIFDIDLDESNAAQQAPEGRPTRRGRRAGKRASSAAAKKKPGVEARSNSVPSAAMHLNGDEAEAVARRREQRTRNFHDVRGRGAAKKAVPKIRPTGKSVARLRRKLGLSMADFARRLGVSATSIRRWEASTGRLKLKAAPLAALAEIQGQARTKAAR